ncbi:MAG: ADP-ribosylglycohydrolase family protein [Verrucomicrobiales bacterium]
MDPNHDLQLELALEVLDGLSVGDALGEALSYQCYRARELDDFSAFADGSVRYTDDTEMALGIIDVLRSSRSIDEDLLAWKFAARFKRDPDRGYGRMARRILEEIGAGVAWRAAAGGAFGGGGSFGNGAAMRVAPLGAYFSGDPARLSEAAARSAQVTHCHPEGIAGAVAVAAAAGAATAARGSLQQPAAAERIWEEVLHRTPPSLVHDRLAGARGMVDAAPGEIAKEFGNGAEISAQDTVPFCIWNACRCLGDYSEAILSTVEVDGDCDTNAAIVGGIVTGFLGREGIPADWLRVRERLG